MTIIPEIGMGCTVHIGSDSHAATIISVQTTSRGETVILTQEDRATRTDDRGYSEHQDYTYEPNPNGKRRFFRQDLARWREVSHNPATGRFRLTHWSPGFTLGLRESHHDYSF